MSDAPTLRERRNRTLGPYSPLFYSTPLHAVSASGVWITSADGSRYLDAYNNVPCVGHGNPRVIAAAAEQWATLNVHTRYLNERVVDYAERLLATFDGDLDRVLFTNSGSESNELALRIAQQLTGSTGVIVSDFSYHGNTRALAVLTTGLQVKEPFGAHVRAVRIPDAVGDAAAGVLADALAEVDAAIASLQAAGHGVSAVLFDPSFSTEGLNNVPEGYVAGLVERVRAAGGVVIADEVQSGFGRMGEALWGHRVVGIHPDLVTLGKPMGNGHPIGGVVTSERVLDAFGSQNMFFNTFAGNPVSSAVGLAVLDEIADRGLVERAASLGAVARERMEKYTASLPQVKAVKGRGLFFGLELVDAAGAPDAAGARDLVEGMYRRGVLISRIGPGDNVLKIRPPLVIDDEEFGIVLGTLEQVLAEGDRTR
ncbi:aspartate aminotransferase family protein [Microbacterium sp.]|uniref:aspartate aminotransferase family protein n=1 Tax=Microbacterium sp. TaxID=51671 RepID=UPI0039E588B6